MTVMTGFRPLRDFMTLRAAVDRLFEDGYANSGGGYYSLTGGSRYLPIDVYETPDEIVVRAHVPGVTSDNLEINFYQGVLTLRAVNPTVETKDGWRWYVHELGGGEVTRQIALPRDIDVDHATADFDNGVLTLTLPKSASAKPRRIAIGTANGITGQQQIGARSEG